MCKNEKTSAHTQMAQKPYAIIFIRCAVANVNCNCQVKWKKAEKRRTKKSCGKEDQVKMVESV